MSQYHIVLTHSGLEAPKPRVVGEEGASKTALTASDGGAEGSAASSADSGGGAWQEKIQKCVEADEINYCISKDRFS